MKAALALLLLARLSAEASLNNAGVNAGQFLQLGAGARPLGMAEAWGPVAEGPEAIYWNPAGLAGLRRPEFSYTRGEHVLGLTHDYAAYAHPVSLLKGTLGVSFSHFAQGSLPVISKANIHQGRSFKPSSQSFALGYAMRFDHHDELKEKDYFKEIWNIPWVNRPLNVEREPWTGSVMVGIAMKVINETLYQRRAYAFAWDGGVLYRPSDMERLSLSATFRNVGTHMRFNKEDESLPLEFGAGAAYDIRIKGRKRLLGSLELAVPYYGNPYAKIGVEYSRPLVKKTAISLRLGYKTLTAPDLSALSGLTFGAGARYQRLTVDFAFQPLGELGESFRIGAGWRF